MYQGRVHRIFRWTEQPKAEAELGRPRAKWGSLGGGQQASFPPARGSGQRYELSSGVPGGASTAQRFSTISSTQDGSPDTVILLIVDYRAAIGGQDPRGPLAHASDVYS